MMFWKTGCGQSKKAVSKNDDHLTVYLWENRLMKNIVPYIHEQFPNQDIEFITGNNDTDLYSYFEEHGELPDIVTVRRFSGKDAQDLEPYLMDVASYDVVSWYYSYALRYYKNSKNEIQWLPICGMPQTIIAMTANAFSEDIQHSLAAGMNAHVSKPVEMKVLEKTIRSIKSGGGTEMQVIEE